MRTHRTSTRQSASCQSGLRLLPARAPRPARSTLRPRQRMFCTSTRQSASCLLEPRARTRSASPLFYLSGCLCAVWTVVVTLLQVLWVALCVVGHVIFGGECRCARNRVLAGTSDDEEFARSEMCMYPDTVYSHHPLASFCNVTSQHEPLCRGDASQGTRECTTRGFEDSGCPCVETHWVSESQRDFMVSHSSSVRGAEYDCLFANDCSSSFGEHLPDDAIPIEDVMVGSAIGSAIGIFIGIWGFMMIHNFSGKGIKACAQLPRPGQSRWIGDRLTRRRAQVRRGVAGLSTHRRRREHYHWRQYQYCGNPGHPGPTRLVRACMLVAGRSSR